MISDKKKIYFRADANNIIGMGHLSRCIAISEIIREDFHITFIIRKTGDLFLLKLKEINADIIQISKDMSYIEEAEYIRENILKKYDTAVLDGYHFNGEYQKKLKAIDIKLISIDDLHQWHFYSDIVINHAPNANPMWYRSEPYTKFCLGLDFAMLRSHFLNQINKARVIKKINKILICFGGSYAQCLISPILEHVLRFKSVEYVTVVFGGEILECLPENLVNFKIKFYYNVSSKVMANLMLTHQLIICPSSTIVLEAIAMQMNVITGVTSDNQKDIHDGLLKFNQVKSVGDFNNIDFNILERAINEMIRNPVKTFKPLLTDNRIKEVFYENNYNCKS